MRRDLSVLKCKRWVFITFTEGKSTVTMKMPTAYARSLRNRLREALR